MKKLTAFQIKRIRMLLDAYYKNKEIWLYNEKEDITLTPDFEKDFLVTINHKDFSHSIETYKDLREVINLVCNKNYNIEVFNLY